MATMIKIRGLSLLLLLLLILMMMSISHFAQDPQPYYSFASSPSFVKQEIIDPTKDWVLLKGISDTSLLQTHDGDPIRLQNTKNISECKIGNDFLSPDIESVSYISNGANLNATVWLT